MIKLMLLTELVKESYKHAYGSLAAQTAFFFYIVKEKKRSGLRDYAYGTYNNLLFKVNFYRIA